MTIIFHLIEINKLIENILRLIKGMSGKSVKVKSPFSEVVRGVRSKGLKTCKFTGEDIPGYQISFQVSDAVVEKIQEAWSALEPHKPTCFFGYEDSEKWMTAKCEEVSENVLKTCTRKPTSRYVYVDVKFEIGSVFVNESGERFPQIEVLGLKKVKPPKLVTNDF